MKMSVREARAQFATALAAAEKGERVTITRNGQPVAELGPPTEVAKPFDWDKLERVRKELGLDRPLEQPLDEEWREWFDHPSWARRLFGPEYFDDEPDAA